MDNRAQMLVTSVRRLLRRKAGRNIQKILSRTHTADVALLLEQLDSSDRLETFLLETSLDRKAEIFSYLDSKIQNDILPKLDKSDVTRMVQNMNTVDAADLLRNLQDEVSQEILDSMVKETKEEVTDLMRYPEDSAGGLMSPDMLALDQELTVSQAIIEIQKHDDEAALIAFYVYVVDENHHLVGVLSLKQLLLSRPGDVLKNIMSTDAISVGVSVDQNHVAKLVERYDFLALPVVDETNKLVGVITVDDVIDVIREEAQEDLMAIGQIAGGDDFSLFGQLKSRIVPLALLFIGGFFCYVLIHYWLNADSVESLLLSISASIPLVIAVSDAFGGQAATVALSSMRGGQSDIKAFGTHMVQELAVSLIMGFGFGTLFCLLTIPFSGDTRLSLLMGIMLLIQLITAGFAGNFVPLLLQKMKIDPAASTISILTTLSNISSVFFLYGFARWLYLRIN